ncbi:GGDEF domain-containing protein [Aquabacterium sp.]|uniref:GGDEF domain-containing protein n=1 Tax=Aquabacterium sp. TaxID=1872578 RepID=UPI00198CFAB0|nr:GGDEF domain-containing protein [Aquabacterium sp.]MBC7700652.1 GGDEF domain-containing protein [Aquabacterium sp.]
MDTDTSAIDQLAHLTAQRDRELLDVSLAQSVLELLGASSVGVYRVLGQDCADQHWLCSGLARRGRLTASDPPWLDPDTMPFLEDLPAREEALVSRTLVQRALNEAEDGLSEEGATWLTVLTLHAELGQSGVLEVRSAQALPLRDLRSMQTLLRVFGNFQNLLESSQRDSLTGLLNRQTFDATFLKASRPQGLKASMPVKLSGEDAESEAERRGSQTNTFWLGVIDIDHFKLVNDRFGHLIGDEVLVLVARIMRQTFRHYDRLFRFGGEEFVVLLRGGTEKHALRVFERFRQNMQAYAFAQVGQVTVSLGFTGVHPHDTPSGAFSRADQAVYQAKHQGRNQTLCFENLISQGIITTEGDKVGKIELF